MSLDSYLDRLRDHNWGDHLVTKRAIAELIDGLVGRFPDDELYVAALKYVASGVGRLPEWTPPSPPLAGEFDPPDAWRWPRPEWEEWQARVSATLRSVPEQVSRLLVIEVAQPRGYWIGIESDNHEYSLFIVDRAQKLSQLKTLRWTPTHIDVVVPNIPIPPGAAGWHYDSSFTFDDTAADIAAQALVLAIKVVCPSDVIVKPLYIVGTR